MKKVLLVIVSVTILISCNTPSSYSIVSKVVEPVSGSSINSFWTTIFARQVIGAQGYKFVVNDGIQTREFVTPNSRFNLRDLGVVLPNTTYSIRVDVLYNGNYVLGIEYATIITTATANKQSKSDSDLFESKANLNQDADSNKLD